MKKSTLIRIEIFTIIITLIFVVIWIFNPKGNFEPIIALTSFIGTIVIEAIKRKDKTTSNARTKIGAEARYILFNSDNGEEVWNYLKKPFYERHNSWHPSYSDFIPTAYNDNHEPIEFEVWGSAGGKYPWKLIELNSTKKYLRLWKGPSKNPPNNIKNEFLGVDMTFEIKKGHQNSFIDIFYEERWTKMPWNDINTWFKNGPYREINWIFKSFLYEGRIDYIRIPDNKIP